MAEWKDLINCRVVEGRNRLEAVQSHKRIRVTNMRGDCDPGLLLMIDIDRDNGNNVISPGRFKKSVVAKQ